MLRVGSLFSGIGGIELGLHRTNGFVTRWFVERDPYAQRVLRKNFPGVPIYDDIRSIDYGTVEPVDVLAGGFPCQDISQAGKGAGLKGEKSGLWFEYLRAIREVRPRYVLVENVALLRKRGLDVVLGGLASLGYDAEWDCVPAAALGAPHQRDRLFIIGHSNAHGDGRDARRRALQEVRAGLELHAGREPRELRSVVADADSVRRAAGVNEAGNNGSVRDGDGDPSPSQPGRDQLEPWPRPSGRWLPEPNVGRVVDGVPAVVDRDRLRCLGNAVVPQVAEHVGRVILSMEAKHE